MTPQQSYPKLAQAIGIKELILKREDLHPFGSHKGRSIPKMIEEYVKQGHTNFVISSSGNAALAAIYSINDLKDISLKVFVGKNIDEEKLQTLVSSIKYQASSISIKQVENPKQQAFLEAKNNKNVINLRQSTDDLALIGYKSLVDELEKIKNLQAIFVPASSGTTAQALADLNAQIHIVQTTACNPIAQEFDNNYDKSANSIAGAIVDKVAIRKEKVIETIKKSQGFGWVVNDEEIQNAINLVKETADIDISENSALSIAGLQKAVKNSWKWNGPVVCLITGK